jgi:hypothetical protein
MTRTSGVGRLASDSDAYSVRQSLEETVKPAISRLEHKVDHIEKQVDSLNIKFYGILGGGALAVGLAIANLLGWGNR